MGGSEMMRRMWRVVIVLLLWPIVGIGGGPAALGRGLQADATSCGGAANPGLIVYGEIGPEEGDGGGLASSALVVMTFDGEDVARIGVPGLERVVPLGVGCSVLVHRAGAAAMLVDAATGTARSLALPLDMEPALFPASWWQRQGPEARWALLSDGDPARGVLVDTVTGETVDLAALVERLRGPDDTNAVFFGSGQVSRDGSHLLLGTLGEPWLIPTADPGSGRRLTRFGTGDPVFSDDGQAILFGENEGGAVPRVIRERLDGSGREIVAEGDRFTRAFWLPGGDGEQLLIVEDDQVSVRTLAEGSERVVTTLGDDAFVQRALVAPSGQRVLLRTVDSVTAAVWTWVDLETGQSLPVSLLDDYDEPIRGAGPGARWRTFLPPTIAAGPEPGAAVVSVDLETGQPRRVLVIEEERVFLIPTGPASLWSADGRFGLINDLGERTPRVWLVDAERGQATELAGTLGSGVSADGASVLVSEPVGEGDARRWRIVRMASDGSDRRVVREPVGAPAMLVR